MKKNLLFPLLLLAGLMSCGKPKPIDPATRIEGRVMDRGTEIPLSNWRVRFIEITYNGLFSNPSKRVVQSVNSDAKGQFAFDFQWTDASQDYEVDVIPADLEKYYVLPFVSGMVKRGQVNKIDLLLMPYAWVNYKIKNINPTTNKDTMSCYAGTFVGKNIDITVLHKTSRVWDKPDSIYWRVIKNSVTTEFKKPISLVPHDTVTFEINY